MKRAQKVPCLGSAEQRLLLTCARLDPEERAGPEIAALVQHPLDWDALLFHARLHSLAPLLHRQLKLAGQLDALPEQPGRSLLQLFHATAYRNRLFSKENARLLGAFREAGIPVMVPKGLSLLEEVYRNVALRPLIDLIFLVPPERLAEAEGLFRRDGYWLKPPHPIDALYRWFCPVLLFEAMRGMRIQVLLMADLNTWPRFERLSTAGMWERAQLVSSDGEERWRLSPEDLLLYLCLQADNHGFLNRVAVHDVAPAELLFAAWSNNRMIRFTDIHLARHHERAIDWDRFIELAAGSALEETAYTSLFLAHRLLGTAVPLEVLGRLRKPSRRGARALLLRGMRPGANGTGVRVARALWNVLRPYWQIRGARLLALAETAFPGTRKLRDRHGLRSRPALFWTYGLHASRTILRSIGNFLWGITFDRRARMRPASLESEWAPR